MSTVDEPARRHRGRPRESLDPGAPPSEWLDGLSPTALHIVAVARSLLLDETYESLTIERVAFEAGVDPSTVKRLFISRAGLLLAVLDRMQYDEWSALVERIAEIRDPQERRDAYVRGHTALLAESSSSVGFVEAVVHGLRDPIVREKIAIAFEVSRDSTREVMDLSDHSDPADEAQRTLASIVLAVADGISLQLAADPAAVDKNAVFEMLADMVRLLLKDKRGD
jgi:AcrR family transcriptional regulator